MKFKLVHYVDLNSRLKENYNFQKLSAVLAEYGYVTMRLSDDWNGADFIAQHIHGERFLRVQLKSRLTFDKKYLKKKLCIAFRESGSWYLYDHDELWERVRAAKPQIAESGSWEKDRNYCFPQVSKELVELLDEYRVPM